LKPSMGYKSGGRASLRREYGKGGYQNGQGEVNNSCKRESIFICTSKKKAYLINKSLEAKWGGLGTSSKASKGTE